MAVFSWITPFDKKHTRDWWIDPEGAALVYGEFFKKYAEATMTDPVTRESLAAETYNTRAADALSTMRSFLDESQLRGLNEEQMVKMLKAYDAIESMGPEQYVEYSRSHELNLMHRDPVQQTLDERGYLDANRVSAAGTLEAGALVISEQRTEAMRSLTDGLSRDPVVSAESLRSIMESASAEAAMEANAQIRAQYNEYGRALYPLIADEQASREAHLAARIRRFEIVVAAEYDLIDDLAKSMETSVGTKEWDAGQETLQMLHKINQAHQMHLDQLDTLAARVSSRQYAEELMLNAVDRLNPGLAEAYVESQLTVERKALGRLTPDPEVAFTEYQKFNHYAKHLKEQYGSAIPDALRASEAFQASHAQVTQVDLKTLSNGLSDAQAAGPEQHAQVAALAHTTITNAADQMKTIAGRAVDRTVGVAVQEFPEMEEYRAETLRAHLVEKAVDELAPGTTKKEQLVALHQDVVALERQLSDAIEQADQSTVAAAEQTSPTSVPEAPVPVGAADVSADHTTRSIGKKSQRAFGAER